jgi:CxxC-x17-CxxC domain-containing protein
MRRKKTPPLTLNKHINFKREREKGNARKDLTDVICIICKKKFTLPFKPRKPEIYCDTCFKKQKNK